MKRKRIERLLSVRRRIQSAGQAVLASAQAGLQVAEGREATEHQMASEARTRLGAAAVSSASELAGLAAQVEGAQRRIAKAAEQRAAVAEQCEAVRAEVVELVHDTRRMEALLDRLCEQERTEQRRREQRETDDVASRTRSPL